MATSVFRWVAPFCLCAGMGAVLAAAGARPDRLRDSLRDDATFFAAAQPILGLRSGPGLFPFFPTTKPKPAPAVERPQRARPVIDLSPVATRLNPEGFQLIAETEGLRLRAYFLAGQWLVGYGHARIAYEGLEITRAEANALLHRDIAEVEEGLDRLLAGIEVNENEYAALVSLAYNLGLGAFERTLVYQRLAAGDRAGAADAFRYLTTAKMNGVRTELAVLVQRRARERDLFLTPPAGSAPAEEARAEDAAADPFADI